MQWALKARNNLSIPFSIPIPQLLQMCIFIYKRAYHGHTGHLIDISPYKHNAPGADGKKKYIHVIPCPDPYRGVYKGYGPETGQLYANEVKAAIEKAEKNGRKVIMKYH